MATDPTRQQPTGAETVNEMFLDALIRHQIGLLRMSGSVRIRIFTILDATEEDIADQIRRRLASSSGLETPADVRRLNRLLTTIRGARLRAWSEVTDVWVEEMHNLARAEPALVDAALKTVSPAVLETTIPSASLLSSIATTRPFEGRTTRQWASSVATADISRIESQVKIGMVQGETSGEIARRVVGSKIQSGRDGVTEITRRQADAITRTAVNAVANQAKREYFRANADLFTEELYVATLDSRTTPICMSLDGNRYPVGKGPIPPMHFQCRSLRVGIVDGEVLGNRPARAFTQQGLLREFTAEQNITRVTSRSALPRGTKGLFDAFARGRMREMTGQVPAKVTYGQWLARQPASFQDDILGKTRGRLFRRGDLELDKFVNRSGDQIPLSQLASRERQAFLDAGLDPENFL